MWVDRYPRAPELNDIVLYRDPILDQILLGRVVAAPPQLPSAVSRQLSDGAVWVEGDNPDCPQRDSRLLGVVTLSSIAGRVLYSW